jgi:hypothetical protein
LALGALHGLDGFGGGGAGEPIADPAIHAEGDRNADEPLKRSLTLGLEQFQRGNRHSGTLRQFLLRPAFGQTKRPQALPDIPRESNGISLGKG